MHETDALDVLVVGGGLAGLSAALWLARYRRRTRVYDSGTPRNEPTWAVHGYPGVPDLPPHELRRRVREQAAGAGAQLVPGEVVEVTGVKDGFRARLADGAELEARRVLLAFGLRDHLPDIPRLEACYGSSVFHCPDCDGPSMTGARVGVIGWDRAAANLALYLTHWAAHVTIFTHGRDAQLEDDARRRLIAAGIDLRTEKVHELKAEGSRVRAVLLHGSGEVAVEGLFFHLGAEASSDLPRRMGCELNDEGYVSVDESGQTSVAGVYAAGDITGPPHLAISAAAEGVQAALTLHRSLLPADRRI